MRNLPNTFLDKLIENKVSETSESLEEKELNFKEKLYAYGLEDIYVDVLTLRFVYNWSFDEIADVLGIPYRQRAYEIMKKAIELLRERKYE